MTREIKLGNKMVGDGHPAYVIAEIGINHNGDIGIAKQMIDAAVHAGADAVKFQKRTPDVATPPDQQKQTIQWLADVGSQVSRAAQTSKEIAEAMTISSRTVDIVRYSIRKKLGINNEKANLQAVLLSI